MGRCAGTAAVRVPQEPARSHRRAVVLRCSRGAAAVPAVLRVYGKRVVHPGAGEVSGEQSISDTQLLRLCDANSGG